MERITFGETDGDAEALLLSGITDRVLDHYVVKVDDKDYWLMDADPIGITVRPFHDEDEGEPPDVDNIVLHYIEFDELHIY